MQPSALEPIALPRPTSLTESDIGVDLDALIQTFDYPADDYLQQGNDLAMPDTMQSSWTPTANADWLFGDTSSDADLLFGALRES